MNHTIVKALDNHGLTNDQIARVAPSVFATEPWEGVSKLYTFIPTAHIVDQMRANGLVPVLAQQQIVRIPGKRDFAKHLLRFRRQQDVDAFPRVVNGNAHHFFKERPIIAEIALTNAHDRTSSFNLFAGLFRLLCSNGLCVPESTLGSIHVRHTGNVSDDVIEGSFRIIDDFPVVLEEVHAWQRTMLNLKQQLAFAKAATQLRWGDEAPVQPQQLLAVRRRDDEAPDLWTTFNRVQENMIKGGLRGHTKTNKRMSTRGINSVTEDTKLNKALWTLAKEMQQLVN
jgi:hypothetical protein